MDLFIITLHYLWRAGALNDMFQFDSEGNMTPRGFILNNDNVFILTCHNFASQNFSVFHFRFLDSMNYLLYK